MIVTPWQLNRRAEFYHQLASMISAGIPLIRALEVTSTNPGAPSNRDQARQLANHLNAGMTFAESLMKVRRWTPEFDIAMLSVGEKSGRLDASFRQLSEYYAARARIIRDTLVGLITTIATLHVFLLIFPLNTLTSLVQGIFYSDYSKCLGFLLQKGMVFGAIYLFVFLLIFACQGNRGEYWRAVVERIGGFVPVLGTARKYLAVARLSAAMEALVIAGVSILDAWQLASAASGSPALRRRVSAWAPELDGGATPGELVNRTRYFPELFSSLYNTGEQSGRLDESLHRLRLYFEEEGMRKLRLFTRVMNGTIYAVVAGLVAVNVISFYVSRFNSILNEG